MSTYSTEPVLTGTGPAYHGTADRPVSARTDYSGRLEALPTVVRTVAALLITPKQGAPVPKKGQMWPRGTGAS